MVYILFFFYDALLLVFATVGVLVYNLLEMLLFFRMRRRMIHRFGFAWRVSFGKLGEDDADIIARILINFFKGVK